MVPVNSLSRHIQPLKEGLGRAAEEVIASGYFVLGPHVSAFEEAFAQYCGLDHCIGVANGTDALELALKAVGVTAGDPVVVAANAAMYGTSAVLACNATPVFADIDPDTACLSVADTRRLLAATPGVKAVIATHLYGRLADVAELAVACREHGVALVEDCAQAHGASRGGTKAGAFGDAASFSFYPTKNLGALGDGGAVTCRDDSTAARVRQLRQYGWTRKYTNGLPGGRNSRLDELQAAFLSHMLPHLDSWNDSRRSIANRYSIEIRNDAMSVPPVSGTDYVAHLYVVRVVDRERLAAHLLTAGIQTDVHYPVPDHRQPIHAGRFAHVSLPVTEADASSVLTLPCFPEMSGQEVDRVIAACNSF